ncbi:AP endonuclease [Tilletiaria anomala UBC 951]|uniref:Apurinic-apyrimidinic endonuclease 1 n=1 Tax=Tilletiaria anomala (strain ATCC 24038 / CBS 436.72 / UBC 951) TaxID=1037660 RepID=A0A066WDQ8_TILAU|nr:AP endonuclease [Tilletiaria anomala UBC 951]KDN48880.1 AP endonuclease [Tilletiaria anomala UBC 951]
MSAPTPRRSSRRSVTHASIATPTEVVTTVSRSSTVEGNKPALLPSSITAANGTTRGGKGKGKAKTEEPQDPTSKLEDCVTSSVVEEFKPAERGRKRKAEIGPGNTTVKIEAAGEQQTLTERGRKIAVKFEGKDEEGVPAGDTPEAKAASFSLHGQKKRSKKEIPTPNSIVPLFARNTTSKHWIGAHVSSAGGPQNALLNALKIGANAVSMFVRPKMQWAAKPMDEANVREFGTIAGEHRFNWQDRQDGAVSVAKKGANVMPHGCYLINLGNPDKAKQDKAMEAFVDDVSRCHQLGIKLYNFHPGSTCGDCTKNEGIASVAACINAVHQRIPSVVIVLENMAGAGNIIGGSFSELKAIMDLVHDKLRVGVCIDTAHAFAAGYDLRSAEAYAATMSELDATIGFSNVLGMHLNDSKVELGSRKDRHENIGAGCIGLKAFWRIMNDDRLAGIPCVLETPAGKDCDEETMHGVWAREIRMLYLLEGLPEDETATEWDKVRSLVKEVQDVKRAWEQKKDSKGGKKSNAAGVKARAVVNAKAKTKGKGNVKSIKQNEEDADEESSDLSEEE